MQDRAAGGIQSLSGTARRLYRNQASFKVSVVHPDGHHDSRAMERLLAQTATRTIDAECRHTPH